MASQESIQQALQNFSNAVGGGVSPTSSPPPHPQNTSTTALPIGLSLDAKNALLQTESWLFDAIPAIGGTTSTTSSSTSSTTSTSHTSPHPNNTVQSTSAPSSTADLCRPLDQQSYATRVGTYRLAWWFAKPQRLNPLECARYGWCNTGPDLLHCKSCRKMVYFQIADGLSAESVANIIEKHCDSLVSAHEDTCAWKGNPSPLSFANLPNSNAELRHYISKRIATFSPTSALPALDVTSQLLTLNDLNTLSNNSGGNASTRKLLDEHSTLLTLNHLLQFLKDNACGGNAGDGGSGSGGGSDATNAANAANALQQKHTMLALFGWGRDESTTGSSTSVCCPLCQRSVGLWNFVGEKQGNGEGEDTQDSGDEEDSERPAKKARVAAVGTFNLLREHRWYCPFQSDHGWWKCVQAYADTMVNPTSINSGNQHHEQNKKIDPVSVLRLVQTC